MSWTDTMNTSVTEWREKVNRSWVDLYDSTLLVLRSSIEGQPKQYEGKVTDFIANLNAASGFLQYLGRAWTVKPSDAGDVARYNRFKASELRYQELLLPFLGDVKTVAQAHTTLGFTPLLVIAGLLLGVGSIAWAVGPAYQYAANLREQTSLQVEELAARERASREGRQLQPSTLPEPSSPVSLPVKFNGMAVMVMLAGAALLGYGFLQKRTHHESVH